MKKLFIFIFIVCHFVLSLVTLFVTFGTAMNRFDTVASPSAFEAVIEMFATVLHFPLVSLIQVSAVRFSASWAGYIPFILNSLLWGAVIYYFVTYIKRKLRKRVDG